MFTSRKLCASCFLIPCLLGPALAQVAQPDNAKADGQLTSNSTVTASATSERVRFTSPNNVVQMHLQVYDDAGQLVFDVSSKGNVLDWTLQDGGGARLIPGSYVSVVTVKSLSGRLSQRIGSISVQEKQLKLERVDAAQMTAGQQLAVGPVEDNSALTILKAGDAEATTVVAHDGTQGEITRSRGALSFRLGDFFSGKDEEQMRLTEEGNLGIGTNNPQAKLDVAGVIRTSKGIEFDSRNDGTNGTNVTKLTTTASGSLQQTLANGTVVTNATGTGTQDRLAKWIDSAGTLGDGGVYESGGLVVIGQNVSGQVAPLAAVSGQYHTLEIGVPPGGKSPLTLAGGSGVMEFWKDLGGGVGNPAAAVSFGMGVPGTPATNDMLFSSYTGSGWNERMRLTTAGNLGIGVNNPTAKLDVAGDAKVSNNLTVDTNTLFVGAGNDRVGIGTANPQAKLDVAGSQPPPPVSSGNGTNASPVLQVIGGDGGGTNDINGIGGTGASVITRAGNGGYVNQTDTNQDGRGGDGGSVVAQAGNGGGGDSRGGNGGSVTLQAGQGGSWSGNGGSITLQAGDGVNHGGGGFIRLQAGANAPSNNGFGSMSLQPEGGNIGVGLGFTSPTFKLHVVDSSNKGLRVQTDTSGGTVASFGGAGDFQVDASGTPAGRFVIKESGKVGIGKPNPSSLLYVDAPSSPNPVSAMTIDVESFQTPSNAQASHFFRVRDVGSGAPSAFFIRGDGNVGIGTETPSHKLEVNGSVAGFGAYQDISDVRFKKNIYPLADALNKVLHLRGVSFDWRRDQFPTLNFSEGRQVGFIAQEMAGVLPEAVTRDEKGYYRMAYSEVTPVLVEAIKEQQQEIQQQQATVRQQQTQIEEQQRQLQQKHARIEKLEARLTALETVVKKMSVRRRRR